MKMLGSKTLLALVAAGMVLAVSPASAFVAVACTAKDVHGKKYTYEYFGIFQIDARPSARSFSMAACQDKSSKPATCKVETCWVTHY